MNFGISNVDITYKSHLKQLLAIYHAQYTVMGGGEIAVTHRNTPHSHGALHFMVEQRRKARHQTAHCTINGLIIIEQLH